MTRYDTFNVKLSNSQLNKLKPGIKTGTQVMLNLSSNAVCECNNKTKFSYQLLLTNTQVFKYLLAFENDSSANKFFSKNQQMVHLGVFLGKLLAPLLKNSVFFNRKWT